MKRRKPLKAPEITYCRELYSCHGDFLQNSLCRNCGNECGVDIILKIFLDTEHIEAWREKGVQIYCDYDTNLIKFYKSISMQDLAIDIPGNPIIDVSFMAVGEPFENIEYANKKLNELIGSYLFTEKVFLFENC